MDGGSVILEEDASSFYVSGLGCEDTVKLN